MRNPFVKGVGGVISADIAVPDHERELFFYSTVLTTGDAPLWRDDLSNNEGTPVIGLGVRTPDYDNLPLQWMPHFQVADVAASANCAIEMGGKEIMHGKADDGHSQWAVLSDQIGAAFGIIPVVTGEPDDTQSKERIGCISWLSLRVPDASASRDFYQRVVGWNAKSIETGDHERHAPIYEMQIDDGSAVAEIRQFRSEHNSIPPVWLIHLPVDDLAESLRRVSEGGGEVIKAFAEEGYAIIRDPVGVFLALQAFQ
jgi:predicted enzyme related to lactoylglutathione lyase